MGAPLLRMATFHINRKRLERGLLLVILAGNIFAKNNAVMRTKAKR